MNKIEKKNASSTVTYSSMQLSTFMTSLNKTTQTTDAELNEIFPFSFLHKLINIAWDP